MHICFNQSNNYGLVVCEDAGHVVCITRAPRDLQHALTEQSYENKSISLSLHLYSEMLCLWDIRLSITSLKRLSSLGKPFLFEWD